MEEMAITFELKNAEKVTNSYVQVNFIAKVVGGIVKIDEFLNSVKTYTKNVTSNLGHNCFVGNQVSLVFIRQDIDGNYFFYVTSRSRIIN